MPVVVIADSGGAIFAMISMVFWRKVEKSCFFISQIKFQKQNKNWERLQTKKNVKQKQKIKTGFYF